MGWITCCNVLSDLYAMGVVNCDNMLLLLGVAQGMSVTEREVCVKLLIEGFRDCALEANTFIRGGQTVLSPWLMIGGVATSVCDDSEYIMPNRAEKGDLLVLTKPLGTQVAVNVHQWMHDQHTFWTQNLQQITTEDEVESLFSAAAMSMTHLNRNAARLMHKYDAHGCTDVTGFGLVGHANNLAKFQSRPNIAFSLHTLPCLAGTVRLSTALNDRFKLLRGLCPETSGGLLILLAKEKADQFCKELSELEGCPAWIVGEVVESSEPLATLIEEPKVIEVEHASVEPPRRST
ncbi:Selenide water dikinase [Fasciola gigantica]|uniref:Selenide water dikinase n=1 Tax=Fasciola gigantica TaxID=46835 RepID=A0A504ZBI9_FASGI|nr:Selenide water dikinase [Fasciola gigantica]